MAHNVIVDRNKAVTITVEKGAKRKHFIEIRRKYGVQDILVVPNREVGNGPANKQTFPFSPIAEVSTFVLNATYVKDGEPRVSSLQSANNSDLNHMIFNFADDNAHDDTFDLQIHVIIR